MGVYIRMNKFAFTSTMALASGLLFAQDKRPNIVIFIADDLGWEELGAYGNPVVKTPNIDRLASEGTRFNNFFLAASSSSPSRSSILSGLYPHNTGAMNLHEDMSPDVLLFPELLKRSGYYTMLIGKSHGTNHPEVKKKFDKLVLADWSKPWTMGDLWIDALDKRPKDKPFFMWAASIDPHRPFNQGTYKYPQDPDKVIVPPYIPDIPEIREELAGYYDEISRFDEHVGRVIDKLKEDNLLNNTLIIVMSDNGRPFFQSKTRVNVQGLKSAFIVYYPPLVKAGSQTNGLASAVDIAPTILDLTGIKKPHGMQGKSMVPMLKNNETEIRRFAFGEHNWHVFMGFERVAISKEYVYIRNWIPELPIPPVAETLRMPAYKKILEMYQNKQLEEKYTDCFIAPRPSEELFALPKDIHCMKNLASSKKYQKMKEEMRNALNVWQESTGDFFPGKDALKQDRNDRVTGEELPVRTSH